MGDMKISETFEMQEEVRWVNHWPKYTPDDAQGHLLGATEEIGETSEIIRKCGHEAIMTNRVIRRKFVTEVADAFSYLVNVLLSYGITAEEFSEAFTDKHEFNMDRDYASEYDALCEEMKKPSEDG